MKKFSLFLIPILIGTMLFVGCGKNEKKSALLTGTTITTTQDSSASPMASSVKALCITSGAGAGAGTTSRGAPAKVGTVMPELGEAKDNGEYSFTNPMGMTIKLQFKKGTDVVYFNLEAPFVTFPPTNLYLYDSQSLSEVDKILASSVGQTTTFPRYIPAMFCKLDGVPIAWYAIPTIQDMSGLETGLGTFIQTNFPDSMVTNVSGSIPGGTISMSLTSSMTQKPTNTNPSHQTGNGTITLNTGQVLDVTVDLYIGANGPVSGTQKFTSSTGESGTMTFAADGSMSGVVKKDGVTIGTVVINADGTGTYTDTATGQTYTISGAA